MSKPATGAPEALTQESEGRKLTATVFGYATINNFAVRKGKVSVVIISTAEYDQVKVLMKEILAKL